MDRSQPLVTFGRERSDVSTFNSPVMLRDQRNLLNKWQDGEKGESSEANFRRFDAVISSSFFLRSLFKSSKAA